MAEQEQAVVAFGKQRWFTKLTEDIGDMVAREKEEVLRIKHEMGSRILQARKESGMDDKTWSASLGDVLTKLADDVGYQVASFYDALKLVQKVPSFSQLRKMEVESTVEVGGREKVVRKPVIELGWDEVKRDVLYPTPPTGPAPVQSQRALIACVFKSEACGGETKQVEICGHHFGDFVVWQNARRLKKKSTR